MEEKKEVENVLRLRKWSKEFNLSAQQRMSAREVNDLSADFIKNMPWNTELNDNDRKIVQVIISTRIKYILKF
jgi:hypothetical protein